MLKLFFSLIIIAFLSVESYAQVFLRLDEVDSAESLKFYTGTIFEIKTKSFPDTWQKKTIESFMPAENTIIFDQGFISTKDITAIRLDNRTARLIGRSFTVFGSVWLVYGGISALAGGEVTNTDAFIGLGMVGSGILIRRLGAYKSFSIKEGAYSLHLIDARLY